VRHGTAQAAEAPIVGRTATLRPHTSCRWSEVARRRAWRQRGRGGGAEATAALTPTARGSRWEAGEAGRRAWCWVAVQGVQAGGEGWHGEVLEAVRGRVGLRWR
jgi:hypothetical protein